MADLYVVSFTQGGSLATVTVEGNEVIDASNDRAAEEVRRILASPYIDLPVATVLEGGFLEDGYRRVRRKDASFIFAALSMLPDALVTAEPGAPNSLD